VFGLASGLLCRLHRATRQKPIRLVVGAASRSRKSRPVISTFPSSVNCLPPNLPFGDDFEPSPVKMVAFQAAFRSGGLWKLDSRSPPTHVSAQA
jgi:hypothetical protein